MTGRGQYNSSLTRVVPVFEAISKHENWLKTLLTLPQDGKPINTDIDLTPVNTYWGKVEYALDPPVALLSWLIRNIKNVPDNGSDTVKKRRRLAEGDPKTIEEALKLLRATGEEKAWYILEGPSYPDAYIVSNDMIAVVEGKRTESDITTSTTWMPIRHQMWRHIDGGWEIRGRRKVAGLLIVEGNDEHTVPEKWKASVKKAFDKEVLDGSFPHRSSREIEDITNCFLGVTTWQIICREFGLNPDEVLIESLGD